jgi:NADH-quinone oxidoreductase subunit G
MSEEATNDTVTLTIDGMEVTVPRGTKVIEAAKKAGKLIPHFCYHPGLPVDGNCRMCIADVRTWNERAGKHVPARRPAVTCWVDAEDKMEVFTETEEVKASREAVMEYLLINHPVDCPICDKAGECMLQDYYMLHAGNRSELRDEKVHKPRLVPFGERILFNGERCILCTRCTRFTEHVTETHELGILNRGDRALVTVGGDGTFENAYTDCVADICPVGALTKTDFRFKKRVWFLKHSEGVCGGCSRGCNTTVDHDGEEIVRIMPRERIGVNDYWMCNEGRDLYKELDSMKVPVAHLASADGAPMDQVLGWIGETLAAHKKETPERVAILGGAWMSNEEAFALSHIAGKLKIQHMDVKTDRVDGYPADEILHTDDHNPNRRGAAESGIVPGKKDGKDLAGILDAISAGEIDTLVVWGPGLVHHFVDEASMKAALGKVSNIIQFSDDSDAVTSMAHAVVPIRNWAQREGSWTNLDGYVSRFRKALRVSAAVLDGFDALVTMGEAAGVKAAAKNVRDARKKLKQQEGQRPAVNVADGIYEFPGKQTGFRHVGGVLEI